MLWRTLYCLITMLLLHVASVQAESIIKDVTIDNPKIDLSEGGGTSTISFHLDEACTVNLFICNVEGDIIRNIVTNEAMTPGEHTETWDGIDDNIYPADNGLYFPILQCKSKRKGRFTYNPSAEPWGDEVPAYNFNYSADAEELTFETRTTAYARLRVGLKDGGPVYRTLAPWQLWQPGTHSIDWNGRDKQDFKNVMKKVNLSYSFDSFTVPEGSIVVENPEPAIAAAQTAIKSYPINPPKGGRLSYFSLEPASQGEEPELAITLAKSKKDWRGKTVVKGKVEYSVDFADPEKKASTLEPGSELIIYVDDVYVAEHPIDSLPASISFDSKKFTNGKHEVTINVMALDDRAGIWLQNVVIKN
jgi:hypothetical protein